MKKINLVETYPVFTKKIAKEKTSFKDVDEVLTYLHQKIEDDPIAIYIGIFDHYSYTSGLEEHSIAQNIVDAKNILCCFGDKLMIPELPAVRPRSFAVVLTKTDFVISFLQAPSPVANAKMVEWVEAIEN